MAHAVVAMSEMTDTLDSARSALRLAVIEYLRVNGGRARMTEFMSLARSACDQAGVDHIYLLTEVLDELVSEEKIKEHGQSVMLNQNS